MLLREIEKLGSYNGGPIEPGGPGPGTPGGGPIEPGGPGSLPGPIEPGGPGSEVVSSVTILLLVFGSVVLLVTDAVFVKVPNVLKLTITVIVIVVEPPFAMAPRSQVTTPLASEHEPCNGTAFTKVTPRGRVSVTTTFSAVLEPALFTVTV